MLVTETNGDELTVPINEPMTTKSTKSVTLFKHDMERILEKSPTDVKAWLARMHRSCPAAKGIF